MKLTTYSRLTQDQVGKYNYNNFLLFNLEKTIRNYYNPVAYYHIISVII